MTNCPIYFSEFWAKSTGVKPFIYLSRFRNVQKSDYLLAASCFSNGTMKKEIRFYRHYKNKPYRFLGIARHSETLEELALYETLYQNDLGRIWVRPKTMFFEDIEINGAKKPRFEKINFNFHTSEKLVEKDIETLAEVYEASFKKALDTEKFQSKLKSHGRGLFITAYDGDKLVGFKIGYAQDSRLFYSWMGAVLPEYQNLGLAGEMMHLQHEWCRANAFKKIETRTRNEFTSMIRLNLNFGFSIIGAQAGRNDGLKIILEKVLV